MSKDPKEHLEEINAKRLDKDESPLIPENHEFRKVEGQPKWDDPINGKVWDCSQNIKTKASCVTEFEPEIKNEVNQLISANHLKWKHTEYCTLIFIGNHIMSQILTGYLLQLYLDYLSEIKGQSMRR
jgi:hypothetical protein